MAVKYETVGRKRREELTVAAFSGGLNQQALPFAVADDQLTVCENFWWREGVLRSRPALRVADDTVYAGVRRYAAGEEDRYVLRQMDDCLITGCYQDNGVPQWNAQTQEGHAHLRVRFDVTRLDGWTAGAGDGTLLFLEDGQITAPLAAGGYQSLADWIYVPLLLSDGAPSVSWDRPTLTVREPLNLLTPAFRAGYTTDGVGRFFHLPVTSVDSMHAIRAVLRHADGQTVTHTIPAGTYEEPHVAADGLRMAYVRAKNCLIFTAADSADAIAPAAADRTDNLLVTARVGDGQSDAACLGGMRFGCWFGGESSGLMGGSRLFVGGNARYPHRIYWSEPDQPLYFPRDNYMSVGEATQAVTALAKQEEMLVIFKEREVYALTHRAQTAADKSGTRFPLVPLHGTIGCDCPDSVRLCRNRLVWLTRAGRVYTLVSGNAYSQCNVCEVSDAIAPLLQRATAAELAAASAVCCDGWYGLLVGQDVLLMNGADRRFERVGSTTGETPVWYRWRFDEAVQPERLVTLADGPALIDRQGRSYRLGGAADTVPTADGFVERPVNSRLCTRLFDFGHADRRKCVREVQLTMGALSRAEGRLVYQTEHGRREDCRRIQAQGRDAHDAAFLFSVRWTPRALRTRCLALEWVFSGAVALQRMCIRYDVSNTTEKGGHRG